LAGFASAHLITASETDFRSKRDKKKKGNARSEDATLIAEKQDKGATGPVKMKNTEYEAELFKLQVELVKLQEWVKKTGARIVILFEGPGCRGQRRHHQAHPETEIKSYVERKHPRNRRQSSMEMLLAFQ
jgi:polyphosphate kinase 2 (PPK2 family)